MIAIVIPVYNRKKFTEDCLRSLLSQTVMADRIIVVDDGSTDGTKELLRLEFPDVKVVQGDGTLFWTAAINLGIKEALRENADYVITMNNDTVAFPNFVEEMMKAAREKPEALLGALDIDIVSREPYYGGEIFHWTSGRSEFLLDTIKSEDRVGLHEVSLFPGRGLVIPRIVFDAIGLFEEKRLPHYMADFDFTLMAIRHGFNVYCNYDAKLYTYPEECGDHKIRKKKSIKNYFNHLFSIRGGGNLRNFTWYTFRNCPPGMLMIALLTGYIRRIGGFWIK